VGGAAVARDRQMLREAGVTHVVNCVGMLPPAAPFADELQYLVLHLLGALCRGVSHCSGLSRCFTLTLAA